MSTADHLATADGSDTASATQSGPNRQVLVAAVLNPVTNIDLTEIVWQAVELKDGSTVQRGSASFAAGVAQAVVSLGSSVDTSRSLAFASAQPAGGQNMGRTTYTGDDVPGAASTTLALTGTTLTLDRTSTAGTTDIGWFVVQFKQRRIVVVQ